MAQRRLHPCPCHSSRFRGRSEGELAMRAWPDLTEYHEAVQHPPKAFADPGLKGVTLELDRFGMPKPATGGNAVVYKANERSEEHTSELQSQSNLVCRLLLEK